MADGRTEYEGAIERVEAEQPDLLAAYEALPPEKKQAILTYQLQQTARYLAGYSKVHAVAVLRALLWELERPGPVEPIPHKSDVPGGN